MIDQSPAFKRIVRGRGATHIVALYVLLGAAWILLSDRLVVFNAPDPVTAALFGTLKGLSYVAVTAALLHWLINRHTTELQEKEERYRTLSEMISDYAYSFRFEPDGRVVYEWVTPSFVTFHGYTLEEIAARGGTLSLVYPDDVEIARDHIRTLLAGQPDSREYRIVRKDGEVRWVRNYARPIWNNTSSRVVRLYGSTQDITDRKRTQEALQESEEQFRSLVEQSPLSIQGLSPDGRTVQVNHAFETLWGIRLDDLRNYNILADQQLVRLGLMPYIQRGFSGEAASIPPAAYDSGESVGTGEKKWVQARIYPVKDKAGNIRQVILIHEDITERKHAEAALRESEERFRIIFEHANDAIHIDNADDKILDVNPRMCELMGYSRDELLKMRIPDLQAPEYRAASNVIVTELARHGGALFESLNLHRNGQRIPVEISVARVARPPGDLYISVIRDVTERKRAEEALRASEERYRGLFAHMTEGFAYCQMIFENGQPQDWIYLTVNEAFEKLTGLSGVTGQRVSQVIPGLRESDPELFEVYSRVALTGQPERFEMFVSALHMWFAVSVYSPQPEFFVAMFDVITDRKRAEEELRQSQAFNQALIDHSPLGISVRNRTGKLLFANAAWRQIWAISDPDLHDDTTRDRDALQFNARDDYLKPYQADLRRVYERGGYLHLPELKTTHPRPGAAEWVSQHFYALTDDQGQVDRVIIMTEDVTDRRRAEEALSESEERYRLLVETSPDPIFLHQNGRFVFVNPAACKLLGADQPGELIGHPIAEVIHPDYHAIVTERVRTTVDQGQPVPVIEEVFLRLDGRPVDVEVAAGSLLIDGRPTMQVIARDITARKQREREIAAIIAMTMALRTAATRDDMFPVIVRQAYDLLNVDGAALIMREPATGEAVIVYGQGVGADSIGLRIPSGSGIVGHVIATGRPYLTQDAAHDPHVFRPDLAHELRALVCAPLIAHDQIIGVLWAGKRTAITDDEGRLLTAVSDIAANALHRAEVLETLEQRVYDRTRELAEANERLTELDRLKSKFVSDVSHELRTPITSLMLNVELLEHGKPEKREQYLSVIRQQTARQVQLIEDILNLSRLELSTARAQFAPVMVNGLVDQAVNVYRSSAEAANLHLNFTPDPGQPVVLGVESHLSQVVTNLIANAINYTPAGSVEVSTRLDGREVVIEVRDTGLGIAPEDMPHLFDRFYRGKLTWQVRGSGLGLAIVKEITEVHKGRVEVDSQAGVGSTFRVCLPIV